MSIKDQIHKTKKQWYAVHCKYKCEKRLVEEFDSIGIKSYVPIQGKMKMLKSGRKTVQYPLIPSYIFFFIDQSEYISILQHPHVFQFLNFSGHIQSIPEEEMTLLKWVVGEVSDINIEDSCLNIGDDVVIIQGELTGLKGVLTGKNNYNFKVVLESLAMGLEIFVDPKKIMKIGSTQLVVSTS